MGSFSYTCSVSGLAIEAGTPVRFCILMENTRHTPGRPTCYPGDLWRLRSLPFRAHYDECGSVDRIEQPMLANMLFDSFKLDAIERGPGDNTYHDVAVRKSMSQKEWFDAISEGRVICRPSWSETLSDPVSSALHDLRFQWHPGTSCGPQFGDWEAHAKYLRGLTDIIESQKVSEEDE